MASWKSRCTTIEMKGITYRLVAQYMEDPYIRNDIFLNSVNI
jgi:hypothetical protein